MHPLLRPPAPLPPSLPPPPERTLLADGALPAARVAAPAPTARQACAAAAGAAGASGAGGLGRAGGGGAGGGVHLLPPKMQLGIWQYHNDGDLGGNWVVPSLSVCVGGVGERWATGWWAAASKPRGAPPPPHTSNATRQNKQATKQACKPTQALTQPVAPPLRLGVRHRCCQLLALPRGSAMHPQRHCCPRHRHHNQQE